MATTVYKREIRRSRGFLERIMGAKGHRGPISEMANGDQKCHTQARKTVTTETEWFLDMDEAAEVIRRKQVFGGRRHIHRTKL